MIAQRRLLEELVVLHERHERPVTATELADRLDADPAVVGSQLRSLRSYELTTHDEGGWAPTVTGRELLDLDIEPDEFVIIDVPDEDYRECPGRGDG